MTIILSLASATALVSCDDDDTYAEKKERERDAINAFLRTGVCVLDPESNDTVLHVPPITVISEEQFYRQDSTTDLLITSIADIIEELSSGMTLLPGTIIATGTPAGVGMGSDPPKFLKHGDVVECSIEGIGTLRNTVR